MLPFYRVIVAPRFLGLLSELAPISIGNITIWPFVIVRDSMGEVEERHEAIHVLQQGECAVLVVLALLAAAALTTPLLLFLLPFLLPAGWPLYAPLYYSSYAIAWLWYSKSWKTRAADLQNRWGLRRKPNTRGKVAYLSIPFEQEAYANEDSKSYLDKRPLLAWVRFSV